jgi:hypothetical protein
MNNSPFISCEIQNKQKRVRLTELVAPMEEIRIVYTFMARKPKEGGHYRHITWTD